MAFTDPAKDSQHVPLHIMEELLSGDTRLTVKLFYALVKIGKKNEAAGVFIRQNLASLANDEVLEIFRLLPTYMPEKDLKPTDTFGPCREGNYLKLP